MMILLKLVFLILTVFFGLIKLYFIKYVKIKEHKLSNLPYNKKINIVEYSPIRGGYSAIIFSVEKEKFFFVGHKSGHSNLVQILTSQEEKVQKTTNDVNEHNQNKKISNTLIEKENTPITSKIETKKPLEQVNISDLLALHKKS